MEQLELEFFTQTELTLAAFFKIDPTLVTLEHTKRFLWLQYNQFTSGTVSAWGQITSSTTSLQGHNVFTVWEDEHL